MDVVDLFEAKWRLAEIKLLLLIQELHLLLIIDGLNLLRTLGNANLMMQAKIIIKYKKVSDWCRGERTEERGVEVLVTSKVYNRRTNQMNAIEEECPVCMNKNLALSNSKVPVER